MLAIISPFISYLCFYLLSARSVGETYRIGQFSPLKRRVSARNFHRERPCVCGQKPRLNRYGMRHRSCPRADPFPDPESHRSRTSHLSSPKSPTRPLEPFYMPRLRSRELTQILHVQKKIFANSDGTCITVLLELTQPRKISFLKRKGRQRKGLSRKGPKG